MTPLKAKTVRQWYRLHKWTSLICTVLLLVACITGLPLVFADELEGLLDHHVKPSEAPADAPIANLQAMVEQAQTKFPTLHPFTVVFDDDEPRVLVNMSSTPNPKKAQDVHEVSFDAHTGRLLEVPKDSFHLTSFLLRLHMELFLDLPGELFMGLMSLTFVVSLVTGMLVYGPFMRRLDFGTYRSHATRRTRWFDLHNLLGIVTLTWALVVGATGVMNALSTPLFGLWRAQMMPKILAPYHGKPTPKPVVTPDQAFHAAIDAQPGMRVTAILYPNPIFSSPRHYLLWMKGNTAVTSQMFYPVLVDVENGSLVKIGGLPLYLRVLELSRPFHFGNYGGMPLKILWALFDAALIVVLVSGVYLWLSKRRTPVERELDALVRNESLKEAQAA